MLVAVLAAPGVQRLLEAVAVRIESRGKRDSREVAKKPTGVDEGRNVRDEN